MASVRWVERVALVVALLVGFAGCARQNLAEASAPAPTQDHVLRIVESQDIVTLNPHLGVGTPLSLLSELTMAYLVRYDHRGRPYPELLTDVPTQENGGISPDGRTVWLTLRHGVRWSDGAPFSSEDVAFSIRVVLNPANDEVSRAGWSLIDRVETHGPDRLMLHLRQPYAALFPTIFGSAGANPCILPRHLLWRLPSIDRASYNALPVGIGPFRYVQWRRGDLVVLEANPFYFRGMPRLRRIEMHFLPSDTTALAQMQSGEADLWPLMRPGLYPQVRGVSSLLTHVIPGAYFSHLDFNLHRPMLTDLRVREALRLATDRDEIRRKIRHDTGTLQEGYAAPGSSAYDATIPFVAYDPIAANRLLDAAGWPRGSDGVRSRHGVRLHLRLVIVAGSPETDALGELLSQMWQRVGVELEIRPYPASLLFDRDGILARGAYDVAEFAWQNDVLGDLSGLYTCAAAPPHGQNTLGYCNPALDRLYDQLSRELSPEHRKPLLYRIQRLLAADVPTIVLSINDNIVAEDARVHNFNPAPFSPFDDMMEVDTVTPTYASL